MNIDKSTYKAYNSSIKVSNIPNVSKSELLQLNLVVVEVEQYVNDDHETVEAANDTTSGPNVHNLHQVLVDELKLLQNK